MKFGFRTPSLTKRIAARTSVKRIVQNFLGLKAPRGWGWLTNPKKAAYNRVYNQTSFGCLIPIIAFVLVLVGVAVSFAKEPIRSFDCMVTDVLDGDTIKCAVKSSGGTYVKIRLYGIDSPETEKVSKKGKVSKVGQPFGDEAQKALEAKLGRLGIVQVDVMAVDRYKRLVGILTQGNRNINKEMVSDGWAWAYRSYLDRPHASEYISAEEQARSQKKGLWAQNNPQPPWEFRKLQKKGRR